MNELMNQLMPYIMLILTAVAGYLATLIKGYIDQKIDMDNQTKVMKFVKTTVEYVEQIGINMDAEAKYKLAKSKIIIWMNQKGMTISEEELEVLIEAFVHNLTAPAPLKEG
jgi:hypothetical protein